MLSLGRGLVSLHIKYGDQGTSELEKITLVFGKDDIMSSDDYKTIARILYSMYTQIERG